jgi:putative flippase GtrA
MLICPAPFKRWLVFNSVGFLGIFVQFAVLATLVSIFGVHYLVATFFAVEAAVLHNFFWHERWTWADRRKFSKTSSVTRMVYFHLTNGTISLFGNIFLMALFVEHFSMRYLYANGISIAICSLLNFLAGDRIVFRSIGEHNNNKGGWECAQIIARKPYRR